VLEMRFKPMPRYEQGAVFHAEPRAESSPTGTLFIQPRVDTRERQNVLLDDVLGTGFAVLCWSNNPRALLGEMAFSRWKALGAGFVAVRPMTQLHWPGHDDPDVVIVGDRTGASRRGSTPTPTPCCSFDPTGASQAPASPNVRQN
jgi:3-(3-hydroxy-phenyl)propionate hydroxylase